MITVEKTFNGVAIVGLIVFGAFLSGIFYLMEGAAIPLTAFQLTLFFGFFAYALRFIITRDLEVQIYGLEVGYLLLLALIFLSLVYSPNRVEGLFYGIRLITLLAMTYLIYNAINTVRDFKIIVWVIVVSGTLVAVKSLYDTYNNPEIIAFNLINTGKRIMRAAGDNSDPNRFAITFALPFMFLLNYIITVESKKIKAILFVPFLLVIAAVLVTYSRSTWVAFVIGGAISIKHYKKYSVLLILGGVAMLVLMFSSTAQAMFISIFQRIKDIFAGSSDDSSNIRLMLLSGAIQMFVDSYTFGVGFQSFSVRFQHYFHKQDTIGVYESHNEYYKVLAELGLVGFLVFMYILTKIVRIAIKNLGAENKETEMYAVSLLCSLVAYLIFFIFYSGMMYNALFFINVALIFTLYKIILVDNGPAKSSTENIVA